MPNTIISPAILRDRTIRQLQQFYQKPIAKVSAELLATLIAVTLLALFAIRPTLTTMSQLLKDIDDRKKTSEALSKKVASLSTLSSEFPTVKNEVAVLHSAIPNTPDFDGIVRRIEKIASDQQVVITALQTSNVPNEATETKKSAALSTFIMTLSIKAQYPETRAFLEKLLKMDRYVQVDSMTMHSEKDDVQKTNILQTTLLMKVAYYGTPQDVVKK